MTGFFERARRALRAAFGTPLHERPVRAPAPARQATTSTRRAPPDLEHAPLDAVIAALGDDHPEVRLLAARTLGQRGEEPAVPGLVVTISRDPEPRVRAEAARALGAGLPRGGEPAVSALVKALRDEHGAVRAAALGQLTSGRVRTLPDGALDTMRSRMRDASEEVRKQALWSYASHVPASAALVEACAHLLDDADKRLRSDALYWVREAARRDVAARDAVRAHVAAIERCLEDDDGSGFYASDLLVRVGAADERVVEALVGWLVRERTYGSHRRDAAATLAAASATATSTPDALIARALAAAVKRGGVGAAWASFARTHLPGERKGAIAELDAMLASGTAPERLAALEAIGELAADVRTELLPRLVATLRDDGSVDVRGAALETIVGTPSRPSRADLLHDALSDPAAPIRAKALELAWRWSPADLAQEAPRILELLHDDACADAAARAFSALPPAAGAVAVPKLVAMLVARKDNDASSVHVALRRVGAAAREAAPALVARAMVERPSPWERRNTLETLAATGLSSTEDVDAIATLAQAPIVEDRRLSLEVLGAAGELARSAAPIVLAALSDGNSDVRAAALRALARIGGDPPALAREAAKLLGDESPATRAAALDVLDVAGADAARAAGVLAPLGTFASEARGAAGERALRLLARARGDAAAHLLPSLEHAEERLATLAERLLVDLGDEAVAPLAVVARDEASPLKARAVFVLERLGHAALPLALAGLALVSLASSCSPATPRDVVPETHDVVLTGDAAAPAPSGGYSHIARRAHGVVALAGTRNMSTDDAQRIVDRLADELDACARGLEEQHTLVDGAAQLVVAGSPRGNAEVTDMRLEPGGAVAANALLCLVAPARALPFPPAQGDAGIPALLLEVTWNPVQAGKPTTSRDAGPRK